MNLAKLLAENENFRTVFYTIVGAIITLAIQTIWKTLSNRIKKIRVRRIKIKYKIGLVQPYRHYEYCDES